MSFHVGRPAFGDAARRGVVVFFQPVVAFQDFAQLAQRPIGLEGFVHRVARRVNLVDGDVDVQVVGVVVHGTDSLMLAITQPRANTLFNRFEGVGVGLLASAKAHQQVKGLVASGARVHVLRRQHFVRSGLHGAGLAVRDCDQAQPFGLALRVRDVLRQASEVALAKRTHGNVLGDHRARSIFLAAKVMARPSAAPRLS